MKRVGNLYEKIYEMSNLERALKNAARNKKNRSGVKKILNNPKQFLLILQDMLINETYNLHPAYEKKIREYTKERQIKIPKFFPDQIIHWAISLVVEKYINKGMYKYCCGSVKGRGIHYCKSYIDSFYRKKGRRKYLLKIDIRKFYQHVDHEKLKEKFRRKFKDKKLLRLLDSIIDNGGEGIPIGFYTSQWFSNFYLEQLDHFIKEILHVKYYARYVDDMVLIDYNKRKLHRARLQIEEMLNILNCSMEHKWQLWRMHSRPLDFVGYKFYLNKTLLRKKIFIKLNRIARRMKDKLCLKRCRIFLSLYGWFSHLKSCIHYYNSYIIKYVSIRQMKRLISKSQLLLNRSIRV